MNWRIEYLLVPRVSVLRRLREAGFTVDMHSDSISRAAVRPESVRISAVISHTNSGALTLFLLRYPDINMVVYDE